MRQVRQVIGALALLAYASIGQAQSVGTIACETAQGGSFVQVKVSLLENGKIKKYKILKGADLLPPGKSVTFTRVTTPFLLNGFRLDCDLLASPNDPTWETLDSHHGGKWKTTSWVVTVGAPLTIGVRVFEQAPGVFRVEIGQGSPASAIPQVGS